MPVLANNLFVRVVRYLSFVMLEFRLAGCLYLQYLAETGA